MKIKILTICLLLFTSQGLAETEYKCADLENHINLEIDEVNKKLSKELLEEKQLESKTKLTRVYCDNNKDGDARLNYVYNLNSSREIYILDEKKKVEREFCSNYKTVKVLFNYVTEVRYLYENKSGKKTIEMSIFKNTCRGK